MLRHLTGTLTVRAVQESPELLFFCLMVSATALGDLSELTSKVGADGLLRFLFSALLFCAAISAILYGSFVYSIIVDTEATTLFQRNLLHLALWMSIAVFLLTTLVQILISRIEQIT